MQEIFQLRYCVTANIFRPNFFLSNLCCISAFWDAILYYSFIKLHFFEIWNWQFGGKTVLDKSEHRAQDWKNSFGRKFELQVTLIAITVWWLQRITCFWRAHFRFGWQKFLYGIMWLILEIIFSKKVGFQKWLLGIGGDAWLQKKNYFLLYYYSKT